MSRGRAAVSAAVRVVRLVTGLFVYALGQVICVQASIGLAPWDVLNSGLVRRLGGTFGLMNIGVAIVLLLVDVLLKEMPGFGTFANAILIGTMFDWIQRLRLIPLATRFSAGVVMIFLGLVCISLGTFLYIGAGFGSGPRDSLMVALRRRLPGIPVGAIRGAIEAVVLGIGWLLGGSVGIGTVISVFGISVVLQATFRVCRFDPTAVRQESVTDTIRAVLRWGSQNQER